MKTSVLVLLLLFCTLQSCKHENPASAKLTFTQLSSCMLSEKSEEWFVTSEAKEVSGTILKNEYSGTTELFIIALDDSYNTKVSPCNLPSAFAALNTKVIVSGKIYSHPRIDYGYAPMELSSIRHK